MNHAFYFSLWLENGEHLDQATFHARYQAAPPSFKAELVGGMVFVSSPVSSSHSAVHALVVLGLGGNSRRSIARQSDHHSQR